MAKFIVHTQFSKPETLYISNTQVTFTNSFKASNFHYITKLHIPINENHSSTAWSANIDALLRPTLRMPSLSF